MLGLQSFPAPSPSASSHLCARCGKLTPGIPVGGMCGECAAVVGKKAARLARWAAIATTLPLAVYLSVSLPADRTARILAAAAVVVWYVLTRRIARRLAWEWLT